MKIGIYGGSFNPPHLGHLIVVESVQDQLQFDKIFFVPASVPPHKIDRTLAPASDRLEMLKLALKGHPVFAGSDIELSRRGYSYTVDTLQQFRLLYPSAEFSIVIGADNFLEIDTWKAVDEIMDNAGLVVMNRPAYAPGTLKSRFDRFARFVQVPSIGISSTDIRLRIKQGRSIRYLVPKDVEQYIYSKALYRE